MEIAMMIDGKYCIGIDIGGTKIAVSAGRERGDTIDIMERVCFATIANEPDKNTAGIVQIIESYQQKYGEPEAIGISCGGPLDIDRGIILAPPNLPGWDKVHIIEKIKEQFAGEVAIENDADACALAEFRYGAGRGTSSMIFLTFGTGLGAGLILNGELYRGAGGNAGEVGHIRLQKTGPVGYYKAGSFEGFCSGSGIKKLGRLLIDEHINSGTATEWAKRNQNNSALSAKEIADAAYRGDSIAVEIMNLCGTRFGEGISILLDVLNPEMIVVGSVFVRCGDLLEKAMREAIAREALADNARACKIVPARLGEQIGDFAALSVAFGRCKAEITSAADGTTVNDFVGGNKNDVERACKAYA